MLKDACPMCLGVGYRIWYQSLCSSHGYRTRLIPCPCACRPLAQALFGWLP